MKSLKVILTLAFLIFINHLVFSTKQSSNAIDVKENVKKELFTHLKYTNELIDDEIEGNVEIIFAMTNEGKLNILQSNSESKILKDFVFQKISNIDISNLQLDSNITYRIVFTFKLNK